MKRSLELLIAEQIYKAGEKPTFDSSLNHITEKKYSYASMLINGYEYFYITVIYGNGIISVWEIDCINESTRSIFSNFQNTK